MSSITITGASGFIGRNLTTYLKNEGVTVSSLSLRNNNWKETLNKQSEAIIHLAGKAQDTKNDSNSKEYFKINRDLTVELFQEFLNSEIKDFFFLSSAKAVADEIDGVLSENMAPNPLTSYGKSKHEAEQYLLQQLLPKDKRLFIIRPCMVHGPGNKGNLNLLYKIVEKRIPWILASFENNRSFLSVDNLCYLIFQLFQKPNIPGGIYNFADDELLSTNELVLMISEFLGKDPMLWNINKSILRTIAIIGDKLSFPLNSERLRKLTDNYVVSNQKIKSALGIERLPLTAKDGLRLTIESFKHDRA